jgi:coenzyme F420-0:L-glutamate ligase/coenzyme F420-1:gamma-L-glutamate ligase
MSFTKLSRKKLMPIPSLDDLQLFLRSRRSIRRFKPDPVPDSIIQRILTTATFAPSAHNHQPWRFVVVTASEVKSRMANAMVDDFLRDLEKDNLSREEINARINKSRSRINTTPVLIILCLDDSEMDVYPDTRRKEAEYIMAVQSVAAAGLQLLLAAHAEGLGGVWTCGPLFAPEVARTALNLPETWDPQAMIFIGYPSESPSMRERKPQEEIVLWM